MKKEKFVKASQLIHNMEQVAGRQLGLDYKNDIVGYSIGVEVQDASKASGLTVKYPGTNYGNCQEINDLMEAEIRYFNAFKKRRTKFLQAELVKIKERFETQFSTL